ncbi:MAG: hypothetical protein L0I62_04635 [Gammaproteobacteria bacterium]|nr:hypothetical protein [Gammaproteobacteria bacterium]
MRKLVDREGHRWEAAVAFGSYGEARVIFSRMDGDELRSVAAASETQREAEQELAGLADETLLERLEKAEPWE